MSFKQQIYAYFPCLSVYAALQANNCLLNSELNKPEDNMESQKLQILHQYKIIGNNQVTMTYLVKNGLNIHLKVKRLSLLWLIWYFLYYIDNKKNLANALE